MEVLLSFDIEEFDAPLESGGQIDFEQQIAYSIEGTRNILALLKKYNIRATFYCTTTFAMNAPSLVQDIVHSGHELASHGCSHSSFHIDDLLNSKKYLEEHFNTKIYGYRMARMMKLDLDQVSKAGYLYDSSLNPTYIPGRYNHFSSIRTIHKEKKLWVLPASVSPTLRIPLFWLSLHNLPLKIYSLLAKKTLKADNYLNIYFHPWEFVNHLKDPSLKLSPLIIRNSGNNMLKRLEYIITQFIIEGATFELSYQFVKNHISKQL